MSLRLVQENLKISCPACEQKLDVSGLPAFSEIACPSCSFHLHVPYRFGQYLLEQAIAEGRFAGVYRARDLKLKRLVAVKILFRELAGNPQAVDLFLGAARRTANLNQANIVPIFLCDCHEGLPFVVMEYLPGGCLYQRIEQQNGPLAVDDCLLYCELAARGLDTAHREGIDHNGIRPTNLLWNGESNIKIADFGMAEFKRECAAILGLDWRAFFHVGYTSPEVLDGRQTGGLPSDVFGLGTTLYHLLTGRRPYSNSLDTRMGSLLSLPPAPQNLRPELPPELGNYVIKLLAIDPQERPHTYREIVSSLYAFRERLQSVAPAAGPATGPAGRRKLVSRQTMARLNQASRPRPRRPRRSLGLFSYTLAGLLLLGALVLAFGATTRPAWYTRNVQPRLDRFKASLGIGHPPARPTTGQPQPLSPHGQRPAHFNARPVPADLDFSVRSAPLANYLRNLPEEVRRGEIERLKYLAEARRHLQILMRYLPYQGVAGVKLKSGRVLEGVVPFCNDHGISVRVRGGELAHVAWGDLAPRQLETFLEYYVDQRQGRGTLNREERTALARDHLMLALLSDWFGTPERAAEHARNAAASDHQTKARVAELLPYLTDPE